MPGTIAFNCVRAHVFFDKRLALKTNIILGGVQENRSCQDN